MLHLPPSATVQLQPLPAPGVMTTASQAIEGGSRIVIETPEEQVPLSETEILKRSIADLQKEVKELSKKVKKGEHFSDELNKRILIGSYHKSYRLNTNPNVNKEDLITMVSPDLSQSTKNFFSSTYIGSDKEHQGQVSHMTTAAAVALTIMDLSGEEYDAYEELFALHTGMSLEEGIESTLLIDDLR